MAVLTTIISSQFRSPFPQYKTPFIHLYDQYLLCAYYTLMARPQWVVLNRADLSQGAERGVTWRGRPHGAHTKETPQEWWGNPKGWEAGNNLGPWRAPTPFQKQHSAEAWRPAGGSRSQVAHSSSKRMMVVLEGRVVTQEAVRKVSSRDELNLRVEEKAAPG